MKHIQWYPGHMAKAMRMMEENLSLCDAVLLVLDARAPAASYNARLMALAKNKPVLLLFNKADLAGAEAEALVSRVKRGGRSALLFSAKPSSAHVLLSAMRTLVADKVKRLQEKGTTRPMRFLVAGIPNTGKSTLINLFSRGKKAQTGDKAGVTRNKQWVKCGEIELLDTPGTMPPSFDDQQLAMRLAFLGSVNDDILALDEVALALLETLSLRYPQALKERYGIEGGTPLELLEGVCARRGLVLRGGEYDYERGERAVIDDLRKGKLGPVCFDDEADLAKVGLI